MAEKFFDIENHFSQATGHPNRLFLDAQKCVNCVISVQKYFLPICP